MKARKWILLVAALTVAVVLLAGCVPQANRGGSQSVAPGSAPTQSVIPAPSVVASDEPQAATSTPPALETKTITLGDTIVTERWEVSVQSVNFGNSDGEGNVWFETYLTVKNLQQKGEDPFSLFDPIIKLELDYNDGFKYTGSTSLIDSTYIKPLETKSNIEYSFKCPKEIEDNTDAPLFLTITVEGVKYQLTIR